MERVLEAWRLFPLWTRWVMLVALLVLAAILLLMLGVAMGRMFVELAVG